MTGFFVYDSFTLKFFFCVDDLSGKYKSGTFNTFFSDCLMLIYFAGEPKRVPDVIWNVLKTQLLISGAPFSGY